MAAVGLVYAPEWQRYPDPATDLDVVRLTNPGFAAGMSGRPLRQFNRRSDLLLYSSDRTGSPQAYVMDLQSGQSKLLTEAAALDTATLTLSADDRGIFFFDGPTLHTTAISTGRSREICTSPHTVMTLGSDGAIYFVSREDNRSRLYSLPRPLLPGARPRQILETEEEIQSISARPRHPQLFLHTQSGLSLLNADGTGKRQIRIEPGETGDAAWTPTGRTLTYLHIPDNARELITLREFNPEDNSDRLIAKTSQFISAGANGDASVFAGASRSKASAYILILVRSVKRELALCEHHASDPRMVEPVFSPDSHSIVFVSDRHGKPALYQVHVERFVEETLSEDQ